MLHVIFANKKHTNLTEKKMITIRKNMLLILSSAIMAVSCSGRHDAPGTVRTVDVATAESMADTSARKYPFISEPCRTAELAFRVGGHISNLTFKKGSSSDAER